MTELKSNSQRRTTTTKKTDKNKTELAKTEQKKKPLRVQARKQRWKDEEVKKHNPTEVSKDNRQWENKYPNRKWLRIFNNYYKNITPI